MAQSVGVIDVVWRGKRLIAEKGSKFRQAGLQNATVAYGRGATRSQEFKEGMLEITSQFLKGERASDIYTAEEGELQIQLDTGQTIVSYDAWMTERPDVTGGEGGKVPLKWAWSSDEEIS